MEHRDKEWCEKAVAEARRRIEEERFEHDVNQLVSMLKEISQNKWDADNYYNLTKSAERRLSDYLGGNHDHFFSPR